MKEPVRIALIGDYNPDVTSHKAIPEALNIAAQRAGASVNVEWIATSLLSYDTATILQEYHGIWTVPASPYADMEGALAGIRYAREQGIPFLGTCGGYQHAILEYARNVLGYTEAGNIEVDPETPLPLIAPLSCALIEEERDIRVHPGSRIAEIYGIERVKENYRCRYGFNPEYISMFQGSELLITGTDAAGEPRAIELANHPFFIGTAYQPERSGLRGEFHPLIDAYLAAVLSGTE